MAKGNPDPWKARIAKTKKRIKELTVGDIEMAQKALYTVLLDGLSRIEKSPGDQEFCRLASAITSAAREFRSMLELGEVEARLSELEKAHLTTGRTRYN